MFVVEKQGAESSLMVKASIWPVTKDGQKLVFYYAVEGVNSSSARSPEQAPAHVGGKFSKIVDQRHAAFAGPPQQRALVLEAATRRQAPKPAGALASTVDRTVCRDAYASASPSRWATKARGKNGMTKSTRADVPALSRIMPVKLRSRCS